jgi:hypothetical protein
MAWIKRNLFFVIGCLVAVGMMGWAGWYLYSKMSLNSSVREQLTAQYAELDRLNKLDPHPGDGRKVDNIKLAEQQQQELREYVNKAGKYFEKIPAIPDTPKVTSEDFAKQLRTTIDQLSREATNSSVSLPPKYNFSFEAQKSLMTFATGSLEPLAMKLGDIKAICDILFRARINALDGIRRGRVSSDDSQANVSISDYLEKKSVTNDLAVLTPYEFTFRSFSTELAAVMSGLANSPHGLIVETINVEPAPASGETTDPAASPMMMTYPMMPFPGGGGKDAQDRLFRQRYGLGPRAPQPAVAPQPTPAVRGGPSTVINEGPLKVTLMIDVVKLKEEAKESKATKSKPRSAGP